MSNKKQAFQSLETNETAVSVAKLIFNILSRSNSFRPGIFIREQMEKLLINCCQADLFHFPDSEESLPADLIQRYRQFIELDPETDILHLEEKALLFTPMMVLRLQKCILIQIINGSLDWNSKEWNIAVWEKDLPCAALAFEELRLYFEQFYHLNSLLPSVPEIKLSILREDEADLEYSDLLLELHLGNPILNPEDAITPFEFDLLIETGLLPYSSGAVQIPCKNHIQLKKVFKKQEGIEKRYSIDLTSYNDLEIEMAKPAIEWLWACLFKSKDLSSQEIEFIFQTLKGGSVNAFIPDSSSLFEQIAFCALIQGGKHAVVLSNPSQYDIINAQFNQEGLQITSILGDGEEQLIQWLSPEFLWAKGNWENLETWSGNLDQIWIPNSHRISEWSHDFRIDYSLLPIYLNRMRHFNPQISTVLHSANISLISLNNLLQWTPNASLVYPQADQWPSIPEFVSHYVEEPDENQLSYAGAQRAEELVFKQSAESRKALLLDLLKQEKGNGGVFWTRLDSQVDGITQEERDYLLKLLDSDSNFEEKQSDVEIYSNAESINSGRGNNEFVVHLICPDSMERLSEYNRVLNQKRGDRVHLILNKQDHTFYKDGIPFKSTVDQLLAKSHYIDRLFKGAEKEFLVIQKLFEGDGKKKEGIISLLQRSFDGIVLRHEVDYKENASEQIKQIFSIFEEDNTTKKRLEIVLNSGFEMGISPDPDILKKALKNACAETHEPRLLIQKLNSHYKELQQSKDVRNAIFYKNYNIEWQLPLGLENRSKLEQLLLQIRNRQETLMAFYRMQSLGIIERPEFQLSEDGKSESFSLVLKRKTSWQYIKQFSDFWKERISEKELRLEIEKIDQSLSLDLFLPKLIELHLALTYQTVVDFRLKSQRQIFECLEEPLTLQTRMVRHWDSRYLADWHPYNLVSKCNQEHLPDLDLLWRYLDFIEQDPQDNSYVSNLIHLRRASAYLLESHGENPFFKLLNSFSVIYLETQTAKNGIEVKDEIALDKAVQYFTEGFLQFIEYYDMGPEVQAKLVQKFVDKLIDQRPLLSEFMEQCKNLLLVNVQTQWLARFNQKFLAEYD